MLLSKHTYNHLTKFHIRRYGIFLSQAFSTGVKQWLLSYIITQHLLVHFILNAKCLKRTLPCSIF